MTFEPRLYDKNFDQRLTISSGGITVAVFRRTPTASVVASFLGGKLREITGDIKDKSILDKTVDATWKRLCESQKVPKAVVG